MKKYLLILFSFLITGTVLAAPTTRYDRTIIPESNDTYSLGSTVKEWLNLYAKYASTTAISADTICLTGDTCKTTWPTGGGSGGGTWSTTTSSVAGQLVNYPNNDDDIVAVGSNSTTTAEFYLDPVTLFAKFIGEFQTSTSTIDNYLKIGTDALDADSHYLFDIVRDVDDFVAMGLTNRNAGASSETNMVFFNDLVDVDPDAYSWVGLASSGYSNPAYGIANIPNSLSLGNTVGPINIVSATSTGYINFGTGGFDSEAARFTSSGHFLLGTTTATALLALDNDEAIDAIQVYDATSNTFPFRLDQNGNMYAGFASLTSTSFPVLSVERENAINTAGIYGSSAYSRDYTGVGGTTAGWGHGIYFRGTDGAGNDSDFMGIFGARWDDSTSGAETGEIIFTPAKNANDPFDDTPAFAIRATQVGGDQTITIDSSNKLTASSGIFNFDNDDLLTTGNSTSTNKHATGNLSFDGEIKPDGATCSAGQILKKTADNDWDCAADDTVGGGAVDGTGVAGMMASWLDSDTIQATSTVVAATIQATSTTASSTLPLLTTTAISIAGEYISNFTTYVRSLFTAGDGITVTAGDFDCDTANGSTFGCLTAADWTTFNNKQATITAGDALTLTGTDIDFDGGATPAGDLGGTWNSPSVTDDSHAHTGATVSGLDVSNDLNLTAGDGLTLTDDDLDCDISSGANFGCLLALDWTTFNNKVSTTSIDTEAEVETLLTDVTNVFTNNDTIGTANISGLDISDDTNLSATYPITLTGDAIGTAFSTSTNNTYSGTQDFSGATVKAHKYPSFSWPAGTVNATTTTATSSIPIGTAYVAETWNSVECWSGSGTVGYQINDGTNNMDFRQATTTVSRFALSTNNTFTASEKRFINVGPLTASYLSCSFDITYN